MKQSNRPPFIDRIERLPRNVRIIILWISVAIGSIIAFTLWSLQLKYDLARSFEMNSRGGMELTHVPETEEFRRELPSLWSSIKETLSDVVSHIDNENKSGANESITPLPETSPIPIRFQESTASETYLPDL